MGLYPRWVIAQSNPDSRMPFQSPPSIASDTGYVERVLQLQCYWEAPDGCMTSPSGGSCDTNGDGYITASESQQDYRLVALGDINTVDPDEDCLISPQYAEPGRPADLPDVGGTCAPVQWSQAPSQVTYTKAADHDCDGIPDGVEVSWGSNAMLADSDGDGAPDFVEMFQFTNPLNPDTDGDGFSDEPAGTYAKQNTDHAVDNCPSVYNPDQKNSDGGGRPSGSQIPGDWASNPNKDKLGDACDPDNDNDGLPDTVENVMGTDPLNPDANGNRCVDGSEVLLGGNPLGTAKCPSALTMGQAKFFRACHWNLPVLGAYGGLWDTHYGTNPQTDRTELDPDNDGVSCQTSTGAVLDMDNDNGPGTSPQISDVTEIEGYNTNPANKDTDGDGCPDSVEITDVNGDRSTNILELDLVARRFASMIPPSDSDPVFDINKDGSINAADLLTVAWNSTLVNPSAICDVSPQPGPPGFRVSIDADATNGAGPCNPIDASADICGAHQVAICVQNPPAAIGAFQLEVSYDDTLNTAPETACIGSPDPYCLDANPDANAGTTF